MILLCIILITTMFSLILPIIWTYFTKDTRERYAPTTANYDNEWDRTCPVTSG